MIEDHGDWIMNEQRLLNNGCSIMDDAINRDIYILRDDRGPLLDGLIEKYQMLRACSISRAKAKNLRF